MFCATVYDLKNKCIESPEYKAEVFGACEQSKFDPSESGKIILIWNEVLERVDSTAIADAWAAMLVSFDDATDVNDDFLEKRLTDRFVQFSRQESPKSKAEATSTALPLKEAVISNGAVSHIKKNSQPKNIANPLLPSLTTKDEPELYHDDFCGFLISCGCNLNKGQVQKIIEEIEPSENQTKIRFDKSANVKDGEDIDMEQDEGLESDGKISVTEFIKKFREKRSALLRLKAMNSTGSDAYKALLKQAQKRYIEPQHQDADKYIRSDREFAYLRSKLEAERNKGFKEVEFYQLKLGEIESQLRTLDDQELIFTINGTSSAADDYKRIWF
jgi:hypothetical protein